MNVSLFGRQEIQATCDLEIEQTPESFHAYSVPAGVDIRPGDQMLIHGVPTNVAFGQHVKLSLRATILRAGWLKRTWTRFAGFFELTELYEVGFAPKDTP